MRQLHYFANTDWGIHIEQSLKFYSISTRIWSSSTVSPSLTCTAFTTPVTWEWSSWIELFDQGREFEMFDAKIFCGKTHPTGKAVLHLHCFYHGTLLAITNLYKNHQWNWFTLNPFIVLRCTCHLITDRNCNWLDHTRHWAQYGARGINRHLPQNNSNIARCQGTLTGIWPWSVKRWSIDHGSGVDKTKVRRCSNLDRHDWLECRSCGGENWDIQCCALVPADTYVKVAMNAT